MVGGSELNYQLLKWWLLIEIVKPYMDKVFWAKRWLRNLERWPSVNPGATFFLSLSQRKVNVGFWTSVANWSMGRWFISTKVNPRHSQTTKWSITDNFSINQNHQGPFQRCRSNIWKNQLTPPKFYPIITQKSTNSSLSLCRRVDWSGWPPWSILGIYYTGIESILFGFGQRVTFSRPTQKNPRFCQL